MAACLMSIDSDAEGKTRSPEDAMSKLQPFTESKSKTGSLPEENESKGQPSGEVNDEGEVKSRRDDLPEEIRSKWEREQDRLKKMQKFTDSEGIKKIIQRIESDEEEDMDIYVGGVDISFVKGDDVNACAALVVVDFNDLTNVVYEDYVMVKLTAPYIPGFLAFREADFLVDMFDKLKKTKPKYEPHVIFVDGNGILHHREFGLACHLGVLLDVPSVGVAKKLFQVDGLEKNEAHLAKIKSLLKGGDTFPLLGDSGKIWGMTLRSCDKSTNPVYVSVGHSITLDSAVKLVHKCCKFRVPEPIRLADVNSREYLRDNFKSEEPEKG